jgi:hypothetical protein
MLVNERCWLAIAKRSAGFSHSSDMFFTKCSHYGAQIKQTKGFDPIQRARRARAFCCLPFQAPSSPLPRMESKSCLREAPGATGPGARVRRDQGNARDGTGAHHQKREAFFRISRGKTAASSRETTKLSPSSNGWPTTVRLLWALPWADIEEGQAKQSQG